MKETSKITNLTENVTLKNLAQELRERNNKTISVTSLTGVHRNNDILKNFKTFIEKDRLNSFEVEDYYLQKNHLPLANKQGLSNAEFNKSLMHLNESSKMMFTTS